MVNMARRGRKPTHFVTSTGQTIVGLIKQKDGRYRILATGQKFRADSESEALYKFRKLTDEDGNDRKPVGATAKTWFDGDSMWMKTVRSPDYYTFIREEILADPREFARKVNLPGLAMIDLTAIPQGQITIAQLIENYQQQSPSTEKTKREAVAALNQLKDQALAEFVNDLSVDKLTAYRQSLEGLSAGSQAAYFSRVKAILAFGLKIGMDQMQLRAALDRCRVLWTSSPVAPMQPHPISREHFHALLGAANEVWRARLLLAMNACMYIADLSAIKWSEIDLNKKALVTIRGKTRIPRVAYLWPETVEALQKLERRGPHIFTSRDGTAYHRSSLGCQFDKLRTAANVPNSVKFADIRDGSYTAAACAATDPRWAKVLAGHSSGMEDHYVLRDVAKVKPACDAVHKAYGPFPASATRQ